jgi:hypothetical protein
MVGWVSVADKTDAPWLAPAKIDCPTADGVTFGELATLVGTPATDRGLACFGSGAGDRPTLHFEAEAEAICGGGTPGTLPEWLAAEGPSVQLYDGEKAFMAKMHPSITVPFDCSGGGTGHYLVEGQFDHPDAADCSANPAASGKAVDLRVAVYECRTRFVVTKLTPVTP